MSDGLDPARDGATSEPGTVLVTGAAGFIGSSVADSLLARGWTVVGLDNFDPVYARTAKETNLAGAHDHPSFSLVEGDVCDPVTLDALAGPFDAVVHLAAKGGVRQSIADPAAYTRANLVGTSTLLAWARERGVPGVVFASSSSVYGRRDSIPFREDDRADLPISPYAATKRGGELLCRAAAEGGDVTIACLRFFTVYGPRQRPDMAIHMFARRLLKGLPLTLYGDGSSSRDYTYIDDAVSGVVRALHWIGGRNGVCEIFNIGSGEVIRLDTLARILSEEVGVELRVEAAPCEAGDVPITCADIDRARRDLGYGPTVDLLSGVRQFVAWLREQPTG